MVGNKATEHLLSHGNLGTVLDTYGGKSLKWNLTVGAAIFGCGQTALFLIRMFQPDSLGLLLVVFVFSVGLALGYVLTRWEATLAKVEVCEGGVRLLGSGGLTLGLKSYLAYWSGVPGGQIELPWDRILKVKVGRFPKARGWPGHVVIQTTDGKDTEFPFFFWAAVGTEGTERFATTVQRFVPDVEDDVDFV